MELTPQAKEQLDTALTNGGLRSTRQREHIYKVLMAQRDHPSADEVYARAKKELPTISLATVYNCLETLVACGLVKRLNYERESSRYCPNDGDHAHFMDEKTGRVYDISLPPEFEKMVSQVLPDGFKAKKVKLSFTGYAPVGQASNAVSQTTD